ncbi:Hypothetical protein FKW44_003222 [Caligus rogercresseyi]|uniref:Uncharacterized protein n=1 Tax=Caligus rogercresseyi TaxID=217165 RepID=A0A7T8KLC3_CALRO|nr:Hypothetical protein FKW44_003222 [Caligus rogercresseyi]
MNNKGQSRSKSSTREYGDSNNKKSSPPAGKVSGSNNNSNSSNMALCPGSVFTRSLRSSAGRIGSHLE